MKSAIKILILVLLAQFFVLSAPQTAHAAVLSRPPNNLGLVGYWSFNEGVGTKTGDSSGQGNTGTLLNNGSDPPLTWVNGKYGKALSFPTQGWYHDVVQVSNPSISTALTVCAWVNKSGNANWDRLVSNGPHDNSPKNGWEFMIIGGGNNSFGLYFANAGNADEVDGLTAVTDGRWHHGCATFNNGATNIYIDGAFSNSGSSGVTSIGASPNSMYFGSDIIYSSNYYGLLDDVRIYNRALSATEVGNLYRTGQQTYKAPTNSGLVGYWSLNDARGAKAGDSSGQGNTGTITGAAWVDGKHGKALSFNGSSDYVDVPDAAPLNPANITMSAWVKTTTAGRYIIAKDPPPQEESGAPLSSVIASPSASEGVAIFPKDEIASSPDKALVPRKDTIPENGPTITNTYTDPNDVVPGGEMLVSADVADPAGVKSVVAEMPYEGGSDILQMNLTKGTVYQGTWQGTWTAHDTLVKQYTTTLTATNQLGQISQGQVYWTDACGGSGPETISLDQSNYPVTAGSTFSVIVTRGGARCTVTNTIQDTTTGSYANVPNTNDPELDCNGDTCSSTNQTTFTKTLKCEAAGNYVIRAYRSATVYSSDSSVTCTAAGKTNVPYALSTVNGGEFLIKSGASTYTVDSSTSVADGKWHYIAATYDGTTMRIYVDGVQTGSGTSFSGNLPTQAGNVRIGADYDTTPANFFNGSIDDVRIYNRALSATEIQNLYKGGERTLNAGQNNELTNGLVGLWSFNGYDISGNVAYDRSGSGNNGTITGATVTQGKVGQALKSVSSSQYVTVPAFGTTLDTDYLTVSSWVKIDSNVAWAGFMQRDDGASDRAWGFGTGPSGANLYAFVKADSISSCSGGLVNTGGWHFITLTYNGNQIKLYVDGNLTSGNCPNTGVLNKPNQVIQVGGLDLNESFDEVRVYNRALSADEVKQLYNLGK
jgi:hypothetical protein